MEWTIKLEARTGWGTVQRLGGSCRHRNHRMWIDENLKSVAEP